MRVSFSFGIPSVSEYPGYLGYPGYPAEVVTSMVSQLVSLDRLRCNFDRGA